MTSTTAPASSHQGRSSRFLLSKACNRLAASVPSQGRSLGVSDNIRSSRLSRSAGVFPRRLLARVPGVASLLALPDADALVAEAGEVFKVERVERYHVLAPLVGWLSAAKTGVIGRAAAKALPLVLKADAAILKSGALKPLASYLAFYGAKELQLGRTFRL